MKLFHIHKWKEVFKKPAKLSWSIYPTASEDIVVVLEQCVGCTKKRAYYKTISGDRQVLDVDFIELKIATEED